jgi:hypothetical protein
MVEATLKGLEQAEINADVKARTEAQQRANAMAARRAIEQEDAAAKGRAGAAIKAPAKWRTMLFIGFVVIILAGFGVLQMMPLSGYIPAVENVLSARLQVPVRIGSLRFTLMPSPQVRIGRILIGKSQDVKVESAIIPVTSLGILDEQKIFDEVQLINVSIEQDAVPRLVTWAQPQTGGAQLQINRLTMSGVKLALHGVELPGFDATIAFRKDGGLEKALLHDAKVSVDMTPDKDAGLRINFTAKNWQPPVGLPFEFSQLSGTALVTRKQVALSGIDGRLQGGALTGAAIIKWDGGLSAEGEFSLNGADFGSLMAVYTRDFSATGVLNLNAQFTMRGQTPDALFAAPRVAATFTLRKGSFNNVDLVRAIQSPYRGALRGGKTTFTEITGEAQVSANRIAYRNLNLLSGPLSGTGTLDVSPAAELSGRLNIVFGSATANVARGVLGVGGSLKDPQLIQ